MDIRADSPRRSTQASPVRSPESSVAGAASGPPDAFENSDSPLQPRRRGVKAAADSTAMRPRTSITQAGAVNATMDGFASNIGNGDKTLVVVGGGTTAMTYLATAEIGKEYTHVAIVGDKGYWSRQSHRLAQPHHILALPEQPSARFVDPSEHDASRNILPHDDRSAMCTRTTTRNACWIWVSGPWIASKAKGDRYWSPATFPSAGSSKMGKAIAWRAARDSSPCGLTRSSWPRGLRPDAAWRQSSFRSVRHPCRCPRC